MLRSLALSSILYCLCLTAAEPEVALWPNGAPGSEGITGKEISVSNPDGLQRIKNVHNPSITVFLPPKEKATGAAMIVCPGGGDVHLSIELEGFDVAKRLNDAGIAVFVLKYRLAKTPGHNYKVEVHSLQDTQRAIRLVRTNAKEWGIDPKRIGVIGFSAGGVLAGLAATRFDAAAGADPIDQQSSRPDFVVLAYPALKGYQFTVPKDAPPAFFVHTNDDGYSAELTAGVYADYRKQSIPAEIHVFAKGGHGFGMRGRTPAYRQLPLADWPRLLLGWMKESGFLTAK